ncbi:MAG: hypothetical protein KGJ06_01690 [Pseudomonadota bacterium]|nr:hypothetical protein [Pseudomonadota bacterium]
MNKHMGTLGMLGLLCACTPQWDMQGNDPVEYYADHPIKNTLQTHGVSWIAHFTPSGTQLSQEEIAKLHAALHNVSPPAADLVQIQLSQSDMKNVERKASLTKALRHMGYNKDNILFEPSADLARDDAQISVTYTTVVAPDCPDWRTSPVTSYSNTWQGNFYCSQAVNLGVMVADPHDLVRGSGDVPLDTSRAAAVVSDYHAGKDYMPATLNAGNGGSSGGSGSSGSGNSSSGGSSSQGGAPGSTSGQPAQP